MRIYINYSLFIVSLLTSGASLPATLHAQVITEAPDEAEEAEEEIVVQATRSGRRVQDEPIRVEVITREEVEEKMLMTPGNVSMLVSETGGVRVQVTAPALGGANVRMQGLNGRYTQLLADGLPLYGGQSSSLGLLQIPPTDLGQVEVIKGAASALYGSSALGGVINLVSRRAGSVPLAEVLTNVTSRDGQDITAYTETPLSASMSASITGGFHRQTRQDLDEDGWIDMSGYERWTARPRLFWDGPEGARIYATLGFTTEDRRGGTLDGRTLSDGRSFAQLQDTDRLDAGVIGEIPLSDDNMLQLRGSVMQTKHRHVFGRTAYNDRHRTLFAEASLSTGTQTTPILIGVALQGDYFRAQDFAALNYRYQVPAIFAQIEHDATTDLTLAGSARLDAHNVYGTFVSPRISALYTPGPWSIRGSFGSGFYAPTPFVEDIDATGLERLDPLSGIKAEQAQTASVDFGYRLGGLEANVTLFASAIENAVRLESAAAGRVQLINSEGLTKTRGMELLLRYKWNGFTATGTYVHVDATEEGSNSIGRQRVATTPKNTAGFVLMWEKHGKGRVGFETYYTGRQTLDENPFRTESRPYVEMGLMGEIVVGKLRLFLNAENLLDVRQTRFDPIVRPFRANDGKWTVDAWAPTDGFVMNGGVRFIFGGE